MTQLWGCKPQFWNYSLNWFNTLRKNLKWATLRRGETVAVMTSFWPLLRRGFRICSTLTPSAGETLSLISIFWEHPVRGTDSRLPSIHYPWAENKTYNLLWNAQAAPISFLLMGPRISPHWWSRCPLYMSCIHKLKTCTCFLFHPEYQEKKIACHISK